MVVENKSIDPEAPENFGIVDCSCGAREDDHGHMAKCERCGCWSHSSCAGLSVSSAESLSIFLCHKCIVHTEQPASVLSYNSNGNPDADPSAADAVPLSQPHPGTCNAELLQHILHLEQHQESKHAEFLQCLLDVEQCDKNDVKVLRLQILSRKRSCP